MRDPYAILGVPKGADDLAVRKAYKTLAVRFHPDRNPDPHAAEQFKEVAAAYAVLTNDRERQRYLRQRRREHAEQEEQRRRNTAAARRRAQAERSRAATAAEEAFREYARQVQQSRRHKQASPPGSARMGTPSPGEGWGHHTGAAFALILLATYLWRSAIGLPLQPWLWGDHFTTHPLHSPIWITLGLSVLMIVKPRLFLMPLLIDGPRDVRLAGWAMLLLFPFISAGGPFLPYRLLGWF